VNLEHIDKRRWKQCYKDEQITAYEVVVYSVSLKCKVKAVYVVSEQEKGYDLLISTDVIMARDKVLQYYRLRFQIEFLIRDARHAAPISCTITGTWRCSVSHLPEAVVGSVAGKSKAGHRFFDA
jgi:hypothetical protein